MEDYLDHLETIVGTSSMRDVVRDLQSESARVHDNLVQCIEALNRGGIIANAHELTGLCLTIGAEVLAEWSAEVEDIARTSSVMELSQNQYIFGLCSDIGDGLDMVNEFIKSKML